MAVKRSLADVCDAEGVRLAFVAANRERLPDPVVPLGLLSVVASCPSRHERRVLDLCFEEDPRSALVQFLERERPDLVAFSLRNLQGNDYGSPEASLAGYRMLLEAARGVTDVPLVLGGGGYSVLPERLLTDLGADYGVAGEGERAFAALVEALEAGDEAPRLPGVFRREGDGVHRPPGPAPFADLAALPFADRRLVDRRHYRACGTESIQTRRGCPLRCTYCTYPDIEGRATRLRPAPMVADELEHVREVAPEVRHFFVVDSVFNLPEAHAADVCAAIVDRGIDLPWTCYVNPVAFRPELAERMAAAGCVGMEIGSDSGDDEVLRRLRKGFGTEHVRRIHRVARDAGLLDCHTFLLGTPGETLDEVRRTLDLVDELDPAAAIFMVWNDEGDALGPPSPRRQALRARILELLDGARHSRPRWIIPALGHRFDARRFALLRRRGHVGPLWQHLPRA